MATVLKLIGAGTTFPLSDVEACIRTGLKDQADAQAILRPRFVVSGASAQTWEPEIDSLTVVEIICSIEELLGITLPPSFVPRGGYDTTEACVQDLVKAASAVWAAATSKETQNA
ncbi:MAG: hypothetical protein ABII76_07780 [Pseudomonadota bacterium]